MCNAISLWTIRGRDLFFHWLSQGCARDWIRMRPSKQCHNEPTNHSAIRHDSDPVSRQTLKWPMKTSNRLERADVYIWDGFPHSCRDSDDKMKRPSAIFYQFDTFYVSERFITLFPLFQSNCYSRVINVDGQKKIIIFASRRYRSSFFLSLVLRTGLFDDV